MAATAMRITSAAWVSLLASLGYEAGSNWHRVSGDFKDAEWPTILAVVILLVFAFVHRLRSVRRQNASLRQT